MTITKIKVNEQKLISMVPFWVIIDREVKVVDSYESQLFWIDDTGYGGHHFKGVSVGSNQDVFTVYPTEKEATVAWRKEMKKFYDETYAHYVGMVDYLDKFKDENLEVFI